MMDLLKRRLCEDPYNISLRYYCLIELILNEKWNDLLDLLEETPSIQLSLIEFVFKYFPLSMINNNRIEKMKQRLENFEICQIDLSIFKEDKSSFECYRNELISSCSSSTSIESFHQSILFLAKAKLWKKSFNWISIGKGECEIIENNQSGEIFLRFWLFKKSSIKLILRVNLHQSDNFHLLKNPSSSFIIQFEAKNACDYPICNSLLSFQLKFNSIMDVNELKQMLSLRIKDMFYHP